MLMDGNELLWKWFWLNRIMLQLVKQAIKIGQLHANFLCVLAKLNGCIKIYEKSSSTFLKYKYGALIYRKIGKRRYTGSYLSVMIYGIAYRPSSRIFKKSYS